MLVRFSAPLWRYDGDSAWHFVSLPADVGEDVRDAVRGPRRGFGSVRVRVTIGGSTWSTSLFPAKEGVYVLPVKQAVRRAEQLEAGDVVDLALELLDA